MEKSNKRKGFTLVELVIVIAVIAILIAVLVPTFTGVIGKANLSADRQLVKNMNTTLTADTLAFNEDIPFNAPALYAILARNGILPDNLITKSKDTYLFYNAAIKKIELKRIKNDSLMDATLTMTALAADSEAAIIKNGFLPEEIFAGHYLIGGNKGDKLTEAVNFLLSVTVPNWQTNLKKLRTPK